MRDLFRSFNGLWVVCECGYMADPDPDSFARSMTFVLGDLTDARVSGWHVPFFSTKTAAEQFKTRLFQKLSNLDTNDYKTVQVISLRQFGQVLEGFLRIGRHEIT